ncbi:hypothetical protein DFH08DRAFT_799859 [Mycena albidolilacea]|uniref:Uncharacterized protein n=1 Tax=Mycena albidolilacea TaxID=1033008 RepID=A0AAD7AM61_9AGAR|nr:hypothetical protein DFH08DRAFT_799859 [Mycena albidolilacea]
MVAKSSVLVVFVFLISGAGAQCPNGGVVAPVQPGCLTVWRTKSIWTQTKIYVGLGEAVHGAHAIFVNPPAAGTSVCHPETIAVPGSSNLGVAQILYCCYSP